MCTAATYKTDGFYFGRTLDYEFSYGDEIVVTPRRFPLAFSGGKALSEHFALLGMAHVADGYPLYYDAMNEKGLCMAGLNFVGNAAYAAPRGDEGDVAQFEFIPWVGSRSAPPFPRRACCSGRRISPARRFPPLFPPRSSTGCLRTRTNASRSSPPRTVCTSMITPLGS